MLSTLETSVIFWVTYFEFWLRPCLRSINFPEIRIEYCRSHCVKNVSIRGFSGPYFPTFELNTEISPYSVWLWEIRITKNLEYGHLLLNVRHLNCSGKEVLKILNYLKQLDTFDTLQIYLRFFFFFQNQNHGDLYQEGSLSSQTIVSRRIKLQKTFLIHFWV